MPAAVPEVVVAQMSPPVVALDAVVSGDGTSCCCSRSCGSSDAATRCRPRCCYSSNGDACCCSRSCGSSDAATRCRPDAVVAVMAMSAAVPEVVAARMLPLVVAPDAVVAEMASPACSSESGTFPRSDATLRKRGGADPKLNYCGPPAIDRARS